MSDSDFEKISKKVLTPDFKKTFIPKDLEKKIKKIIK